MLKEVNAWLPLFLWIIAGTLAGLGFNLLLKSSIMKISRNTNTNKMASFYAFSALRILIVVTLLFIAFTRDIRFGFGCLMAFIVSRWVSVLIIASKKVKV